MKNIKFIVSENTVTTEGFKKDGTITHHDAGLSHTDVSDHDEVREYFEERYPECNVIVEFV